MKKNFTLIVLLGIISLCNSQESILNKNKIVFIDDCNNKILKSDNKINKWEYRGRMIQYTVMRGIWKTSGIFISDVKRDTIKIHKIALFTRNENGKEVKAYLNCDKICNGIEKDYYANGKIRLKGDFKNGKPIDIKLFDEDARIIQHTTYIQNSFIPKKEKNFDLEGKLLQYWEYEKERKLL